jgi:hypothetical protein
MRKLAAIGTLAFTLALGLPAVMTAATPAAATSPAIARAAATHHVWVATVKTGTLHGSARLVLTKTYSSGYLHVTARGVKTGDMLDVRVTATTSKGKTVTIVSFSQKATSVTSGVAKFSLKLSLAKVHLIRADVSAHDTLTFHLKDGTLSISAAFVKKS